MLLCARVLGVYVYLRAFLLVRTFDTVCGRVLVPGLDDVPKGDWFCGTCRGEGEGRVAARGAALQVDLAGSAARGRPAMRGEGPKCLCGISLADARSPLRACGRCGRKYHSECCGTHLDEGGPFTCVVCICATMAPLVPSRATLVIVPGSLITQWQEQAALHIAPQAPMSVAVYAGMSAATAALARAAEGFRRGRVDAAGVRAAADALRPETWATPELVLLSAAMCRTEMNYATVCVCPLARVCVCVCVCARARV